MNRTVEVGTHISNTPEAVIGFISDVSNRLQYVDALKEVSNVQGDAGLGQTWAWKFVALGNEFEGPGRCTQYEAGKLYAFETTGGAQSTWTYRAEQEGDGTKLSLTVEYTVPDDLLAQLPPDADPDAMEKAEADRTFAKLQEIIGR
jgi:carbon monoxide dehydrogenase subunit G